MEERERKKELGQKGSERRRKDRNQGEGKVGKGREGKRRGRKEGGKGGGRQGIVLPVKREGKHLQYGCCSKVLGPGGIIRCLG